MSTLQSGPEPCLGDLGRFASHVVAGLQLSATLQPLARRPLLASDRSSFFFFIPCFLCLLCKIHVAAKRKKSGGEWEKREVSQPEIQCLLLLRKTGGCPADSLPASPGRGAGTPPPLIPEDSPRWPWSLKLLTAPKVILVPLPLLPTPQEVACLPTCCIIFY